MSQIPSDPILTTPNGSRDARDERAPATLSAQSATNVAPATSATPTRTPNHRRQSQRARNGANPTAKNGNAAKDAKETSEMTPAQPATTAEATPVAPAEHSESAPGGAANTAGARRRRNPSRPIVEPSRQTAQDEKPGRTGGRGAKANKASATGKADATETTDAARVSGASSEAQTTPLMSSATQAVVTDGQSSPAGQTTGPLIVPVTTHEAQTGRGGHNTHRGGRSHERRHAEPPAGAAADLLTITLEPTPLATDGPQMAPIAPVSASSMSPAAPDTMGQVEEPGRRYRFDSRPRVAPQPGGFAQPRNERLSGLYTTPTISPEAIATTNAFAPTPATPPTEPVTQVAPMFAQGAPVAEPEPLPVEAPAEAAPAPSAEVAAQAFGAPRRRFGDRRRIPVPTSAPDAAPAVVSTDERSAPPTEPLAASANVFDAAELTAAEAAEAFAIADESGDEDETSEENTPTRGASTGRGRRRRRRKSSLRTNADAETEERADATQPDSYEDVTDAAPYGYAAAEDDSANEYAPEYTPGYANGGYAPGYGRDYTAEYGEPASPAPYGEPYAPAPFTPAPYAPAPTSFAPAPYTPGARSSSGQSSAGQGAGQWQGNTTRNTPPVGRSAPAPTPPASTNPYSSPEPAFARGFGPQPNGVASTARDQYAPYTRNGRNGERNGDSVNVSGQVNAVIRDAKDTFQQQTDRLLTEMRRQQTPPTMTVAFPALPSTERVGVFVDVANVLYSARNQRITVDFGRLLDFLRGNRRLIRAHAYAPTSPEPSAEQSFLTAVKGVGYRITTKNYKTFASGAKKADLDLDICMDIVRLVEAKALDTIVLVSGDSDFLPVLEYCSDHGVRVEVAAFEDSAAMILRQSCDVFINLSLLDEIRN